MPHEGMHAVACYLSVQVGCVVQSVTNEGAGLSVLTDDGETIDFILRPSTAAFHSVDGDCRLRLLP